jgi:hypothetical protein
VGRPDELKGQAISAFVTLESGNEPSEAVERRAAQVGLKRDRLARPPDDIRFTEQLPKTRSGKIMRRLLRELATHGEIKGDTTTLEDFTVIAKLREAEEGATSVVPKEPKNMWGASAPEGRSLTGHALYSKSASARISHRPRRKVARVSRPAVPRTSTSAVGF